MMNITLTGITNAGRISQDVLNAAKKAERVVLQTEDISPLLSDCEDIKYETLEEILKDAKGQYNLVDLADDLICDGLIYISSAEIYFDNIAHEIIKRAKRQSGIVKIIDGGDSSLCLAFEQGVISTVKSVLVHTATSFDRIYDYDDILLIKQIKTTETAASLKTKLLKCYDREQTVFLADSINRTVKSIPLYALDGVPFYGYYISIIITHSSFMDRKRYAYSDLIRVMDTLRSKNGCPWDKEQTHASLKRYLIEESYEVLEAIDSGDTQALYDELGDVLLQVVFHAKIAQQNGEFDDTDITTAVCAKMISRHTHIFGSGVADTASDVIDNWEKIKKDEKGQKTQTEVLRHIPKSMPALLRSEKVQHKAAHIGFDFRNVSEALFKLREEIDELEHDVNSSIDAEEEFGDLLFAVVNISRLAQVEPETALQKATDKFISRFEIVEKIADSQNVDMQACSIDKLNELWEYAKLSTKDNQ